MSLSPCPAPRLTPALVSVTEKGYTTEQSEKSEDTTATITPKIGQGHLSACTWTCSITQLGCTAGEVILPLWEKVRGGKGWEKGREETQWETPHHQGQTLLSNTDATGRDKSNRSPLEHPFLPLPPSHLSVSTVRPQKGKGGQKAGPASAEC